MERDKLGKPCGPLNKFSNGILNLICKELKYGCFLVKDNAAVATWKQVYVLQCSA